VAAVVQRRRQTVPREERSMSSSADRRHALRVMALALAVASLVGCYESHLCDVPEVCDYFDQDCDDLVDEDFVDEDGVYFTVEHCGACGVSCADVFPTAAETACVITDGVAACEIVSCPVGFHRAGDGSCAPDAPVVCLPCNSDEDCALRLPGSTCDDAIDGGGRCAPPCGVSEGPPCPVGTECDGGYCRPIGGDCTCNLETLGLEVACLVDRGDGYECAGAQVCAEDGFGACEPALTETCNDQDDDCDGGVDEDFRDDAGRYVDRLHCGACASPCVEPGPNMIATCVAGGGGVRCDLVCDEGFVDVDRISANGCECERWDGGGPPPVVGGDADCDGIPDDTTDFVYVSATGSDTDPGTLARPVRRLARAVSIARREGKDILVSRGIYEGPFSVPSGVNVFGGYRPDFADRDLELYPVLLEARRPGAPVLVCEGVTAATRIEGFILSGSDATLAGEGSTTLYVSRCGAAVTFAELTILAGRGADGIRGADSSDNLSSWGLSDLGELTGVDGTDGTPSVESTCRRVEGGRGGSHACRSTNVAGGSGGAGDCPDTGCVNGSACGNAGCTDFTSGGVCDLAAAVRVATPNPAATAGRGPSGGDAGELTYNSPTNRGVCNFCDDNPTLPRTGGIGGDGLSGTDGGAGTGCSAAPLLDIGTGQISGGGGTDGVDGRDGSGGGGGTSGSGYAVIGGTTGGCNDRSGGAGGGGGSGGCGAPGADAGSGGGTSAAVVVRIRPGSARGPTFDGVRVVTASGGRGGDGGIGASGGSGGVGGLGGGARFWCSRTGGRGGDGGRGGAGGGGGGGCGGGTHGFYLVGGSDPIGYGAELLVGATVDEAGVPGRGGLGGFSPGASATGGLDGVGDPIFIGPGT